MVYNDVQDNFHAASVSSINKVLKIDIFTLVAFIHGAEVKCVVAMVVIAGSVSNNRSNPNSGKAECFDVIQFFNKSFEISSPSRVSLVSLHIVPALPVVARVAIIEASGHYKIDCFVTEICAVAYKSRRIHVQDCKHKQYAQQRCENFFHDVG